MARQTTNQPADGRPLSNYIYDCSYAQVINAGDSRCQHYTIVEDGIGRCRKCGRLVDYHDPSLVINARRHMRRSHPNLTGVTE